MSLLNGIDMLNGLLALLLLLLLLMILLSPFKKRANLVIDWLNNLLWLYSPQMVESPFEPEFCLSVIIIIPAT